MKKSLFNTLGAIGIISLIALNVYVVTSKETPAFLKWDAMSYIFANGNSGSGSGGIPDGTRCGTNYNGSYCGYVKIDGVSFQIYWP